MQVHSALPSWANEDPRKRLHIPASSTHLWASFRLPGHSPATGSQAQSQVSGTARRRPRGPSVSPQAHAGRQVSHEDHRCLPDAGERSPGRRRPSLKSLYLTFRLGTAAHSPARTLRAVVTVPTPVPSGGRPGPCPPFQGEGGRIPSPSARVTAIRWHLTGNSLGTEASSECARPPHSGRSHATRMRDPPGPPPCPSQTLGVSVGSSAGAWQLLSP